MFLQLKWIGVHGDEAIQRELHYRFLQTITEINDQHSLPRCRRGRLDA